MLSYKSQILTPRNSIEPFKRLSKLNDCPRQLYLRGSYVAKDITVAVIGSRKHSQYGRYCTYKIVTELASSGITIISGLALGIDGVAHEATLSVGGKTVAIMPGGLDKVYPASHRNLAQKIINQNGALISEYPDGTLPQKQNFVARNRIIAALADAVLVIEAAQKSGTLITVGFALDIGLPIMAIPGPIDSPSSQGTNNLIKTGAIVVTSAQDVLNELGIEPYTHKTSHLAQSKEEQRIIDVLSVGLLSFNEIVQKSSLPVNVVNTLLTKMELNGTVNCRGNNIWSLS